MIWRQQISALSITKLWRGLGRKLQVEGSRPAATSSRNLQSWIQDMGYLNPQRPRIIMVATSGCPISLVHSKFGGRSVWWLKSTKDVSVDTNTGSVTFIGWGTFVPEIRHCYYMDEELMSSFDSCQSAPLVFAFLWGRAISVEEASILGTPEEGKDWQTWMNSYTPIPNKWGF